MSEVIFKGPAGRIEGRYHQSENPSAPVALIMHPDSEQGGTFNNVVVYTLYKLFVDNGFSVLRFNFRGAGRSQGKYNGGEGELLDATVALDWLHQKNMDAKSFWIAGFSFGAWIALRLAMRRPEVEEYILIAPLAKKNDFNFIVPCAASGLIIHGDYDEVVSEDHINILFEKLVPKNGSKVKYVNIEGADHFFREYIDELTAIVSDYIKKKLVETFGKKKKVKRDRRRRRRKKKGKEEHSEEKQVVFVHPVKSLAIDD